MIKKILLATVSCVLFMQSSFAQDISGVWRQIDDKTGAPKALIEIRKENNGTFSGKIIKVTPVQGYTPKQNCVNCPAPFTNKPILGLDIINNLSFDEKQNSYNNGRILDPLSGKIYSMKAKLSANGKRLQMRGYVGVSALGRSQTWIRDN